jgi:hypothetical protein
MNSTGGVRPLPRARKILGELLLPKVTGTGSMKVVGKKKREAETGGTRMLDNLMETGALKERLLISG